MTRNPSGGPRIRYNIPCITTLSAANAAALGIRALIEDSFDVQPLQSLHAKKAAGPEIALLGGLSLQQRILGETRGRISSTDFSLCAFLWVLLNQNPNINRTG